MKGEKIMRQVERHWIKEEHALYPICDDLTFKAKNLFWNLEFQNMFLLIKKSLIFISEAFILSIKICWSKLKK